jgi:hypothetical protein
MRAWWPGSLSDLRLSDPSAILGTLSTRLAETHSINRETQIVAWRKQIEVLRDATADLAPDCRLLLEYPLLRLGRRIDAVVLICWQDTVWPEYRIRDGRRCGVSHRQLPFGVCHARRSGARRSRPGAKRADGSPGNRKRDTATDGLPARQSRAHSRAP